MIKEKWKPHKQKCKHCGKLGTKQFGNEKYFHKKCKRERVIINNKNSIKIRKDNESKVIDEYLNKINNGLIRKERKCNMCDNPFNSDGSHNQICEKCNIVLENEPNIVTIYKYPDVRITGV